LAKFLCAVKSSQHQCVGAATFVSKSIVKPSHSSFGVPEATDDRTSGRLDGFAGANLVDNSLGRLDGHLVQVLPICGHNWGVRASSLTLDPFEGELSVRGHFVVPNAQVLGKRSPNCIATKNSAQRVNANANVEFASWSALVHGVETRHRGRLSGA